MYLLKYRLKDEYTQAFSLLDSSFKEGKEELSYYDLYMYMYSYNLMVKTKKNDCANFVNDYLKVIAEIQRQEKAGEKIDKNTVQKINDLADICINCDIADSLYQSQFQNSKNDTAWLDNGINVLSSKNCNTSVALLQMLEERFKTKQELFAW